MLSDGATGGAPLDRYVVQEYLAEGGMGAIYLGKKLGAGGFEKQVVLKQLLPEFTQQPEFIDLFLREAKLSATLDHANIIHTIDLVTAGDEYFIVMEFLNGADLRTLLKRAKLRKGRFSAGAAMHVAREMLSALAYAHSKLGPSGKPLRLIHRDISPSNILISAQGEVKLTDFGIAKASTHNSVFYRVKGKVGYMSPEQARSEPLDARSDLYSLAVCLYEMITGERLFLHVGITTSAEEMYRQPVPLVSRKISGLPAELDKVMLKALSVDRDHRYQTAGEFQEALLRVAHRHSLMMSAPEMAEHLTGVCGDPVYWRELEVLDGPGADGTEIYDPVEEGTQQILPGDEDSDVLSAIHGPGVVNEGSRRQKRAQTSITHLSHLQNVELTSLVPSVDNDDSLGAQPLVDLNSFGAGFGADATGRGERFATVMGDSASVPELYEDDSVPEPLAGLASSPVFKDPVPTAPAKVPTSKRAESPAPTKRKSKGEPTATIDPPEEDEFDVAAHMAPERKPWLVILFLLLIAGGIAAAIGLSGPEIPESSKSNGR